MTQHSDPNYRSGYIAIVGRPNVGKSTLLNYILGEKLAITSRKPQTTRQNLLGIHTADDAQFIFVDTPGLHLNAEKKINQYMNKAARLALEQVDVIVHICDSTRWTADDDYVLTLLGQTKVPVIAVLNKIDLMAEQTAVIPAIDAMTARYPYKEIVPVSALKNRNVSHLLKVLASYLPLSDAIFPKDQLTTASMRFIASEIVREKLFKALHQEIPYALAVITDSYQEEAERVTIFVTILLERASQKPIVIGKGGKILKLIGSQARKELQTLVGKPVELRTWVKIKDNWSDNESSLQQMGLNQGLDSW